MIKKSELYFTSDLLEEVVKMRTENPRISTIGIYFHFFPLRQVSYAYFYKFLKGTNAPGKESAKVSFPQFKTWSSSEAIREILVSEINRIRSFEFTASLESIASKINDDPNHRIHKAALSEGVKLPVIDGALLGRFVTIFGKNYTIKPRETWKSIMKDSEVNKKPHINKFFNSQIDVIVPLMNLYEGKLKCNEFTAQRYYEHLTETNSLPSDFTIKAFKTWLYTTKANYKRYREASSYQNNLSIEDFVKYYYGV